MNNGADDDDDDGVMMMIVMMMAVVNDMKRKEKENLHDWDQSPWGGVHYVHMNHQIDISVGSQVCHLHLHKKTFCGCVKLNSF